MSIIEEYLEKSENKKYLSQKISEMSEDDKVILEKLTLQYKAMHAKDPLKWAVFKFDNTSTSYFSLLRDLTLTVEDVDGCLFDAEHCGLEYCTETADIAEQIIKTIGQEKFENFMKAYMMGAMWQITNLLDDGNYYPDSSLESRESPEMGWVLCATDKKATILSDDFVTGLHESIMDFREEIDPEYLEEILKL